MTQPTVTADKARPAPVDREDASLHREARPSFDALYQASNAPMIRLGWLLVGSRAVAEELVHDAFMTVYERWDSIDNPGGYLRSTVVNNSMRWQRRRHHEHRLLAVVGEPPPTGDPAVDTMWDAIQRLRTERRAVIVLRYWADLPHGEIARILDCPASTVRTRLHRALADLRKEVDR